MLKLEWLTCCSVVFWCNMRLLCAVQMVSAVCQFPTVQSAVEASVAIKQWSIPVARIGLFLYMHMCEHCSFLVLNFM